MVFLVFLLTMVKESLAKLAKLAIQCRWQW
jgi:hypothetical protein